MPINKEPIATEDHRVQRAHAALHMLMALRHPTWGRFITSVGTRIAARGQLIDQYLARDLTDALQTKRVAVNDVLVARDVVLGSIFYGIGTMLTEPTHEHHAEQLVATFLRGMGVAAEETDAIAFMPLADVGAVQGPIFSTVPAPRKSVRGRTPAGTPRKRTAPRRP